MTAAKEKISPPQRRFPALSWVCASSPLGLLFLFVTLGLHVRLGLGHWPAPMAEDYDTSAFRIHDAIFGLWLNFSVLGAGPLWVLCLVIRPLRPLWPRMLGRQLALFVMGWLLIATVLVFDRTQFLSWILD